MTDDVARPAMDTPTGGAKHRAALAVIGAALAAAGLAGWLLTLEAFQPYGADAPYGLLPLPVGDVVHLDLGLVRDGAVSGLRVEPILTAASPAVTYSVHVCPAERVRTLGLDPDFGPPCAGGRRIGPGAPGSLDANGEIVVMSVVGLEPGRIGIQGARVRYRQGLRTATQHSGWRYGVTVVASERSR